MHKSILGNNYISFTVGINLSDALISKCVRSEAHSCKKWEEYKSNDWEKAYGASISGTSSTAAEQGRNKPDEGHQKKENIEYWFEIVAAMIDLSLWLIFMLN